MIICPICKRDLDIMKNDVWVNDAGYRVSILDWGEIDIWILYLDNGNKVAWKQKDFFKQYKKE